MSETVPRVLRLAPLLAAALLATAPVSSAAKGYVVGPGDVLSISIRPGTGEGSSVDDDYQVSSSGTIDVPWAGRLRVGGMTTPGIQSAILRQLKQGGKFREPSVSVNVTEYGSQPVNVHGAVNDPVRIFLEGPMRLVDALAEAGGIDEEKAGQQVRITRSGADAPMTVERSVLFGSDAEARREANVFLEAHDDIYVPSKGTFCITGPIEKDGCYDLEPGATFFQALASAGGFTTDVADLSNITIWRADGSELRVDYRELTSGQKRPPVIEDGDQIVVAEEVKTEFCISGPVENADCYELTRGLTLQEAVAKAGGFDTLLADESDVTLRRGSQLFKLGLPDDATFPVERGDSIVVGEKKRVVTVSGTVKNPGTYDYFDGMTIVDAIALAGGHQADFGTGKLKKVRLIRGSETREVNVKAIEKGEAPDVSLEPGDKIVMDRKMW